MTTIPPTLSLLNSLTPISQGAEAKVYRYHLHGPGHAPILFKHRFAKQYRHATLDAVLTKARVAGEARMLLKCLRSGVRVPGVRMVDAECGVLGLEWVEGRSVRSLLGGGDEGVYEDEEQAQDEDDALEERDELASFGVTIQDVMQQMGVEIAKMHQSDVIHGDLTTSNMMLRPCQPAFASSGGQPGAPAAELVLIDFGLSFVSNMVEDKAVDLYVLERAFASTHPDSEPLFDAVLNAYGKQCGKAWGPVHKRLEAVRLRGRKRSMVG